jgi:hypothetical protein
MADDVRRTVEGDQGGQMDHAARGASSPLNLAMPVPPQSSDAFKPSLRVRGGDEDRESGPRKDMTRTDDEEDRPTLTIDASANKRKDAEATVMYRKKIPF